MNCPLLLHSLPTHESLAIVLHHQKEYVNMPLWWIHRFSNDIGQLPKTHMFVVVIQNKRPSCVKWYIKLHRWHSDGLIIIQEFAQTLEWGYWQLLKSLNFIDNCQVECNYTGTRHIKLHERNLIASSCYHKVIYIFLIWEHTRSSVQEKINCSSILKTSLFLVKRLNVVVLDDFIFQVYLYCCVKYSHIQYQDEIFKTCH